MSNQKRGGTIQFQTNGVVQDAKGNFTYNLGRELRETVVGSDGVHGFKTTPQAAFIEGAITDRGNLDLNALVTMTEATISLRVGNGKMIVLRDAWYAGEGTVDTEEGEIAVRFEGKSAEEISA